MIKTQIEIIERNTARLLRLPEDSLFDLKLTEGMSFLEREYDEEMYQAMSSQASFWTWWRMAWASADQAMVQGVQVGKIGIRYSYHEPGTPEDWKVTRMMIWPEVWTWYKYQHQARIRRMAMWPPEEIVALAAERRKYEHV